MSKLILFLIIMATVVLGLSACAPPGNQVPVIRDVIHANEVPASMDTLLICRTNANAADPVRFKWLSDNGTIKGDGGSVTWTAPATPGVYAIGVKATDSSGTEDMSTVSIRVVTFDKILINIDPEVSLSTGAESSYFNSEARTVGPMISTDICFSEIAGSPGHYHYKWECNGGKIQGPGLKEGTASRIGWASPGVPGLYTVVVTVSDNEETFYAGSVYFNVANPGCNCK